MYIGLEISGGNDLIRDFKGYKKEADKVLEKAISDTAKAVEDDAKDRLGKYLMNAGQYIVNKSGKKAQAYRGHGGTGLLGSIYNRFVKGKLEKIVGTVKHYAPYIEFGTGDLVFTSGEFTPEQKAVASQFRGKGLRKVNIRGDSFLGWAGVNQGPKFRERIIKGLNNIKRV